MGSSVIGSLRVYIDGNNKDLLKKLRSSENAMRNTRSVLNKVGGSMQVVGGAMTKGITVPILGAATALGVLTKKSIDFEKQMKEVFTLLPGITKDAMDSMTADTTTFAKEMGILPEKVVKPLYDSLSAGVPKENVFEFMKVASKNSIGGVAELASSVDVLTSVINAYKMEISEAGNVSDILFTTVRLGKTTISELASSISDVTSIAGPMGVRFEDIGAAMATMTAQGISSAESTTAIKSALNALGKESTDAYKLFKKLTGKSFPEFIDEGNNLSEALNILDNHAQANNSSINNLFSSIQAGKAVLSLTGDSAGKFTDNIREMEEAAGATDEAFKTMEKSVSRKLEKLKTSMYTSLIQVGNKMLPIVEEFIPIIEEQLIPAFEKIATKIGEAILAFSELEPEAKKTKLIFLAIFAGAGPALSGIGKIATGISSLSKALGVLKIASTALFSPAGLLIAGVAGATAGMIYLGKKAEEKVLSNEFNEVVKAIDIADLNAGNLHSSMEDISKKTGFTIGQVLEIAENHGLITEELKDQAKIITDLSREEETVKNTTKEIAEENRMISSAMDTAAAGFANMADVVENYSKNMGISVERALALATRVEFLSETQKEQLANLKLELEERTRLLAFSSEFAHNEYRLFREEARRLKKEQEITAEKEKQIVKDKSLLELEQQKLRVEGEYKEGYKEILDIIKNEISEVEELEKKLEHISKFDWGDNSVYTEKQNEAIKILESQIEELENKTRESEEEKLKEKKDKNQEWADQVKLFGADEIAQLKYNRDQAVLIAEEEGLETHNIKKYYALELDRLEEELAEKDKQRKISKAQQYVSLISSTMSSIGSILSQSSKNKTIALDNEYKEKKDHLENTITNETDLNEALESLDEEHDKKKRKMQYEEAKRAKTLSIFNAILNGANAVMSAMAMPWPVGLVMAGIATVMSGIQIGMIASQPLPALEKGAKIRKTINGSVVQVGEGANDEAVVPLSREVYQEIGKGITDNMGTVESIDSDIEKDEDTTFTANIELNLDGKNIAKSTVDLINNGFYVLEGRAV